MTAWPTMIPAFGARISRSSPPNGLATSAIRSPLATTCPSRRRISGCGRPSGPGGEQTWISSTPATSAGTAFMMTLDGSGAVPAGTYSPARSTGEIRWPYVTSSPSSCDHDAGISAWWKRRTLAAACSRSSASSAVSRRAAGTFSASGRTPSNRSVRSSSAASPRWRTSSRMVRTEVSIASSNTARRSSTAPRRAWRSAYGTRGSSGMRQPTPPPRPRSAVHFSFLGVRRSRTPRH